MLLIELLSISSWKANSPSNTPFKFGVEKLGLPVRSPPRVPPRKPEIQETTFSVAILAQFKTLLRCSLTPCRRATRSRLNHGRLRKDHHGGRHYRRRRSISQPPGEGVTLNPACRETCSLRRPRRKGEPLQWRHAWCCHCPERTSLHPHRQQCRSRRQLEGVTLKVRQLLPLTAQTKSEKSRGIFRVRSPRCLVTSGAR